MGKFTYGALAFGLTPLALAANAAAQEQFELSIGIRETNQAAGTPLFSNGGSTGSIEHIARDVQKITADGTWQQFTFTFGVDSVTYFAGTQPAGGAPNQLDGAMGVFEQIRVRNFAGSTDPIRLYIDDIVHNVGGTDNVLTDFESFVAPTANGTVLLRQPSFSGSSSIAPAPAPNLASVVADFAHTGANSLLMNWEYGNALPTNALRLTTSNVANFPNPLLDLATGSTFSFWAMAMVDHPVQGWITNGNGDWSNGANWADGLVPNAMNAAAKFLGTPTVPVTVNMDTAIQVNNIQFSNANSYTISGANPLMMDGNNTIPMTISVATGSHTISAPILVNNTFNDGQNLNVFVVNGADKVTLDSVVKDGTNLFRTGIVKGGAGTVELKTVTMDLLTVSTGTASVLAGGAVALAHPTADAAATSLTVSSGATLNVGGNTFAANSVVSNGTITQTAGATTVGPITGSGILSVNGGTLTAASLRQNTLNVASGATAELLANGGVDGMLRVSNLNLPAGASLDMNDNDLILNYPAAGPSPEFAIRDLVAATAMGGTSGIFFEGGDGNRVLAIAEGTESGLADLNGVVFPDATVVIGKHTYYGDANLDGQVTSDDYVAVDVGIGVGDSWVEGDFDFSGSVTSDDYVAIDVNLGQGTTSPLAWADLKAEMVALHTAMFGDEYVQKLAIAEAEGFAALVPEPTSLSLIGLGAVGLLARRRRAC